MEVYAGEEGTMVFDRDDLTCRTEPEEFFNHRSYDETIAGA
ncbi:hypothetical protein [Halobacillus kuroshimensis]|nr:hypothetical protein [Halobacillus kuroshimensis]